MSSVLTCSSFPVVTVCLHYAIWLFILFGELLQPAKNHTILNILRRAHKTCPLRALYSLPTTLDSISVDERYLWVPSYLFSLHPFVDLLLM